MTNCVVISYRRLSISELFHLKWHGPDRPCHSSATTLAGHGAEMKIRKPRSRWADDVRPEKIMKTYTRICTFFCSLHVSGYQKLGTLAKKLCSVAVRCGNCTRLVSACTVWRGVTLHAVGPKSVIHNAGAGLLSVSRTTDFYRAMRCIARTMLSQDVF